MALSDKEPAVRLAVVASDHEQSVPIFQQLAGGHPSVSGAVLAWEFASSNFKALRQDSLIENCRLKVRISAAEAI
jgi:hypothetical protein